MTSYYFHSVVLSNCLLLIAFIYGKCSKQLCGARQVRWYVFYLGFILGIEVITKVLIFIFKSNNTQSIYPFYVAGEFFILLQLFLAALKASKKWRMITILIASLIFIESITLWFMNGDASTGLGKIFSHLAIICTAACLLVKNLKELETSNSFVIIYSALFFYYAVSLFLFLLMGQLTKATISIWIINNTLSAVLYGSSIYAFYRLKRL